MCSSAHHKLMFRLVYGKQDQMHSIVLRSFSFVVFGIAVVATSNALLTISAHEHSSPRHNALRQCCMYNGKMHRWLTANRFWVAYGCCFCCTSSCRYCYHCCYWWHGLYYKRNSLDFGYSLFPVVGTLKLTHNIVYVQPFGGTRERYWKQQIAKIGWEREEKRW